MLSTDYLMENAMEDWEDIDQLLTDLIDGLEEEVEALRVEVEDD